jgi:hypothetical protein
MAIARKDIESERAMEQGETGQGETELEVFNGPLHATETGDTSYQGVAIEPQSLAKRV